MWPKRMGAVRAVLLQCAHAELKPLWCLLRAFRSVPAGTAWLPSFFGGSAVIRCCCQQSIVFLMWLAVGWAAVPAEHCALVVWQCSALFMHAGCNNSSSCCAVSLYRSLGHPVHAAVGCTWVPLVRCSSPATHTRSSWAAAAQHCWCVAAVIGSTIRGVIELNIAVQQL